MGVGLQIFDSVGRSIFDTSFQDKYIYFIGRFTLYGNMLKLSSDKKYYYYDFYDARLQGKQSFFYINTPYVQSPQAVKVKDDGEDYILFVKPNGANVRIIVAIGYMFDSHKVVITYGVIV